MDPTDEQVSIILNILEDCSANSKFQEYKKKITMNLLNI